MFMNRLMCPNFHESDNWLFARMSAKYAEREKKRGRAKDSLKPKSTSRGSSKSRRGKERGTQRREDVFFLFLLAPKNHLSPLISVIASN
jgi:hypothetical protein